MASDTREEFNQLAERVDRLADKNRELQRENDELREWRREIMNGIDAVHAMAGEWTHSPMDDPPEDPLATVLLL